MDLELIRGKKGKGLYKNIGESNFYQHQHEKNKFYVKRIIVGRSDEYE